MSRLTEFVKPRPKRWVVRATSTLNRVAMLYGVPVLRDLWPFSLVPGIRPIANIRRIDLPQADEQRLKLLCGPGKATFITPNHPEFFTDWMVDKELLWRVAPMAASWATHTVVNGMGSAAQKFWLANNLIAQIPGNSDAAKRFSSEWAAAGNGVLLHPEGAVGWHNDYVGPVMPGAIEMAGEALQIGRLTDSEFRAYLVPVVWKLVFLHDAEPGLRKEAGYVERRLGLPQPANNVSSPERVFAIYRAVMERDAKAYGVATSCGLRDLVARVQAAILQRLVDEIGAAVDVSVSDIPRLVRRWVRDNAANQGRAKSIGRMADDLQRIGRLSPFAFADPKITQEQTAEHLKRLRNDYCKGTLRDTLNAFVPQPVAPRRAIVRVAEPLEIGSGALTEGELVAELRRRLQATLDLINVALGEQRAFRTQPNPFYEGN